MLILNFFCKCVITETEMINTILSFYGYPIRLMWRYPLTFEYFFLLTMAYLMAMDTTT
jgi:hypothetical protein